MRLRFILTPAVLLIICFSFWKTGRAQQPPPRPIQVPVQTQMTRQTPTQGPTSCHVAIKGARQGQFKGEGNDPQGRDKLMSCLQFSYSVASVRNPATGQPAGRRQYSPLSFTKEWGPASPQVLAALATNEVLTEVDFDFVRTDASGKEYVSETVTDRCHYRAGQAIYWFSGARYAGHSSSAR